MPDSDRHLSHRPTCVRRGYWGGASKAGKKSSSVAAYSSISK